MLYFFWSLQKIQFTVYMISILQNAQIDNMYLTAVFFKLVQCQPQLNCEIQPFVVEGVRFSHT